MRIRDDPEHHGRPLKRSICGGTDDFTKYIEAKR